MVEVCKHCAKEKFARPQRNVAAAGTVLAEVKTVAVLMNH
jgi:hypothetical protein